MPLCQEERHWQQILVFCEKLFNLLTLTIFLMYKLIQCSDSIEISIHPHLLKKERLIRKDALPFPGGWYLSLLFGSEY